MKPTENHGAAQARFAVNQEAERKRLIRLCNVAAGELKWKKNDVWEDVKLTHGGQVSLADMDVGGLEKVLAFAKSKGFKIRHKKAGGKSSRPLSQDAQARMLRGLWLEMHSLGFVRAPDESALCAWEVSSREGGERGGNVATDLKFLTGEQLDSAIERLKKWRRREIMKGEIFCPECGQSFRPSPKQADAFGRIACDAHQLPVPYGFRRAGEDSRR